MVADGECRSCDGYGHFDEDDEPTIDRRGRKCGDCNGTGRAPAEPRYLGVNYGRTYLVACPDCGARPGVECSTKTGTGHTNLRPHKARQAALAAERWAPNGSRP